jgi:hypothetical protein
MTFEDKFKELIIKGLIINSEDGEKLPHENSLGWFITPEARVELELLLLVSNDDDVEEK